MKVSSSSEASFLYSKRASFCYCAGLVGLIVAAWVGLAPLLYAQSQETSPPEPSEVGGTPLHAAASRGQDSEVRHLLLSGVDVNAKSASGATPLHLAAAKGHPEVVEALLLARAPVDDVWGSSGETALLLAIRHSHPDVALQLLKAGANPSAADRNGLTCLHSAIQQEQFDLATALVERGANVNSKIPASGETPLHYAASSGNMPITVLLLAHGAAVNTKSSEGYTPLFFSVASKQVGVSTALLQAGADPDIANNAGETPLHSAAFEGHAQLVSILLAYGANVDARNKGDAAAALHLAANSPGNLAVIRWLVNHGAIVNEPMNGGVTPLHFAAASGDVEVAKFLVAKGAKLDLRDAQGETPLWLAAALGKEAVAEFLVSSGAAVDTVAEDGTTPLFRAADREDSKTSKTSELLLAHGANPNAQNKEGFTPLLLAVRTGNEALANALIDKGADFETRITDSGVTPLLFAVVRGNESIVRLLLGRGANLKATAKGGYSALILALAADHAAIASYLIEQGADVNAQDTEDHLTALYLAASKGQADLVKLLIEHGAELNVRRDDGRTPLTAALDDRHIAVAEQLVNAGAREDFEHDPSAALLVDMVRARSSRNQKRYEQIVLRGGVIAFLLAGMYVDEALTRRALGEDDGGFLEIAQDIAKIHAAASGTDQFTRSLQGYSLMTQDECKKRLADRQILTEAREASAKGKLDEALRLGEQALQAFDKSDDQISRFQTFIHLAETYSKAGRSEQADIYVRKLDLLLTQWGYAEVDSARLVLGTPHPKEGEKDTGLPDAKRFAYVVADFDSFSDASAPRANAEQGSDSAERPSRQTPQADRIRKANAFARDGKDADALREYQVVLSDSQTVTDAQRAEALSGAARAARRLHQFGHATVYYAEAHRLLLKMGDPQAALTAQLGLADLLSQIGRSREAVDYYTGALKAAKASKSAAQSAMILSRLGNLFSVDGDQVRAIEYYENALTELHKPGSLEEAVLLMNIGTVYARADKSRETLHYYEYVLKEWKDRDSAFEAQVRVNLALAYQSAGNNDNAWKQIEALNSLDSVKTDPELAWRADRAGALIQLAMAHPELAEKQYAKATDQLDRIDARSSDLEQAAQTHILERRRFVYREYLDLLVELAGRHPGQGYEARILELSEKIKSRIFTDMVARSNAARATPGMAKRVGADRDRELELSRLEQQLDAELQQLHGDRDEKKIELLRTQIQLAEQRREAESSRPGQVEREKLVSSLAQIKRADELQSFLGDNEIVVSYALGIHSVVALAVRKDQLLLVPLPTNPAELEGLVSRFRTGLDDVGDWQDLERFDPVAAYQLYEKVLKPLTAYLPQDSHIIVCGDELLYSVPLEALVDEPITAKDFARAREMAQSGVGDYLSEYDGLHYVIDKYVISYLPSISVLTLLRERQTERESGWKRPLIAFGDPVFNSGNDAKAPDANKDTTEPIVVEGGDTMVFKTMPKKDIRVGDYNSVEDLLSAMFQDSTLSLKRGDKVLVDDIKGKDLFGAFAFTPDVERQFFKQALTIATGGRTLERLRDTNAEVRLVAQKTGAIEADLFLRDRASKANLYSIDLRGTRYLLFATHGFLGGDFSGIAEPALALSQTENPQGNDGFLTTGEVSALDLDAELVVLSACNTAGLGQKAFSGEGFAGLTRSFMAAGADSLLVSHWSVDSQATRDVVSAFFDLKNRLSAAEALREAKRSIKRDARPLSKQPDGLKMSQSHPFFWAPFIFVGVEPASPKRSLVKSGE